MKIWKTNHFKDKKSLLRYLRAQWPGSSLRAVQKMMRRQLSVGELHIGHPRHQPGYQVGLESGQYVYMREEDEVKVRTIEELIADIGLPAGYQRLMWEEAQPGQTVWLWCQHDRLPRACGPHEVIDPKKMQLQSLKRKIKFLHYSQDLLVLDGSLE